MHGATTARRRASTAAVRDRTTTGRRPTSCSSHHQTSPRCGRLTAPPPAADRGRHPRSPGLPTHQAPRPGAGRTPRHTTRRPRPGGAPPSASAGPPRAARRRCHRRAPPWREPAVSVEGGAHPRLGHATIMPHLHHHGGRAGEQHRCRFRRDLSRGRAADLQRDKMLRRRSSHYLVQIQRSWWSTRHANERVSAHPRRHRRSHMPRIVSSTRGSGLAVPDGTGAADEGHRAAVAWPQADQVAVAQAPAHLNAGGATLSSGGGQAPRREFDE